MEALKQAEKSKEDMKQKIAEVKQRMETEVYPKLKEYEVLVEELKKLSAQVDEAYKSHLSSLRKEVIEPYRELLVKSEEIKNKLKEYDEVVKSIPISSEKLEKLSKEKPQIYSILSSYARRSTPEEEGKWVADMLDEKEETLKEAALIGKEIGYTNIDLMPILAALGLKSYKYSTGVNEEICKTLGVEKRTLENYIVHIAIWHADTNVLGKIQRELSKQ
jgi:DNA repair exonuclease SbcCD ATPase subunit